MLILRSFRSCRLHKNSVTASASRTRYATDYKKTACSLPISFRLSPRRFLSQRRYERAPYAERSTPLAKRRLSRFLLVSIRATGKSAA
ncbi:MAG: hypothetical protein MI923_20220 [Phycisphaerales bacterium]|nr:hypothetical protein [Phycisphaerales bacterium]